MKTNLIKLKVKSKSLAEEARIIRKEERKALNRFNNVHATKEPNRDYWEWTTQEQQAYNAYASLHTHRTDDVRRESRATHLAIAFLKGRTYRSVERNSKDDYDKQRALLRAAKIAFKYIWNDHPSYQLFKQQHARQMQAVPRTPREEYARKNIRVTANLQYEIFRKWSEE